MDVRIETCGCGGKTVKFGVLGQTLVMPEPIPDTPENILHACLRTLSKKDRDYFKPGSYAYTTETPPTRRSPRSRG